MPLYMPGDKVSYVGEKLKEELGNSMGVVHAHLVGNPRGLVVDFGNGDSIVVDESKLAPFQGHLKGDGEDKRKKDVKVEKRRSRRRDSEDEE